MCWFMILQPPLLTLFPYTTLFRSVVIGTRRYFRNCDHVVLCGTKHAYHREVATFIGQKAHRLSFLALFRRRNNNGLFVRYRRSEEHTSELQSQSNLVCRLLLEKKN